jgi:hypothetical protein
MKKLGMNTPLQHLTNCISNFKFAMSQAKSEYSKLIGWHQQYKDYCCLNAALIDEKY